MGLGIHGEPGVELIDFRGAKAVAEILSERLFRQVGKASGYALLLNNLGSTTLLEMGVLANEFLSSANRKKIKLVIGPGLLVTSLDMHGFSASLLPLNRDYAIALAAPVGPAAWPGARVPGKLRRWKLPKGIKNKDEKPSSNASVAAFLSKCCDLLIAMETELNALDAKVGDGDTGSTVATGARNLKVHITTLPLANPVRLLSSLVIFSANPWEGRVAFYWQSCLPPLARPLTPKESWARALQQGLARMKEIGGAKTGDRTMIDALEPALAALADGKPMAIAAEIARAAAKATASMQRAGAGRSTYVSAAKLTGIPDPGAMAVAKLLEGLAAV